MKNLIFEKALKAITLISIITITILSLEMVEAMKIHIPSLIICVVCASWLIFVVVCIKAYEKENNK